MLTLSVLYRYYNRYPVPIQYIRLGGEQQQQAPPRVEPAGKHNNIEVAPSARKLSNFVLSGGTRAQREASKKEEKCSNMSGDLPKDDGCVMVCDANRTAVLEQQEDTARVKLVFLINRNGA